ncbi:MAG: tape measure protein [Clostridium sp.]
MATINNAIAMQDRMSPVFNKMIKAMNSTLKVLEKVNKASNTGVTGTAFKKAQKDINAATNAVTKFNNQLNKTRSNASNPINVPINTSSVGGGLGLLNVNAGLALAGQIKSMVQSSTSFLDNLTLTKARLDLINDGTQTTVELQDKLLSSADRARMSYEDMAKSVSKLNMLASEQFTSNEEAIAFVETLNKMFVVSGTGAQEAQSAMYQLTQAMASGKLQGDEFRSIMENAPMLAEAIANYVGKSKGELKTLSSEGAITADIIKGAMFNAVDDVNSKFEQMPMTFGQKMEKVKNIMMTKMSGVAEKFSEWLNSEQADVFFDALATGIAVFANIAMGALDLVTQGVNFLRDAFIALEPVLIVGAILLLAWILSLLPAFVIAVWDAVVAVGVWAIGLLIANWPLLLIALAIGILIGLLYALGFTFAEVVGFILGLVYAFGAIVYNIIITLVNPFIILANFIRNIFIDPIASIKMLFYDLGEYIIGVILWVAKAIEDLVNLIPFVEVNITSGLENIMAKIELAKAEIAAESGVKETKLLEYKDIGGSFGNGFNTGSNFINNFGNNSNGFGSSSANLPIDMSQFTGNKGPIDIGGGKLDEVGKIKGDVSITDEDIKLLKDIASTDFINSYTTLRPEMKVEFSGPVNETADVNKILAAIEDMAEEALSNVIIEEAS